MAIYRRKSGRYAVAINYERDHNGRRVRKSLGTFATKKDAERAERDALAKRDRGEGLVQADVLLSDLIDRFMIDRSYHWAPKTVERNADIVRCYVLPHLPNKAVGRLQPQEISDWLALLHNKGGVCQRPLSKKSVRHVYNLMRLILNWAIKLRIVATNVVALIDPPKVPRREASAFSPTQIGKLRKAAQSTRLDNMIVLALCTGARRGELAALRWDDVNFEEAALTIRRSRTETRSTTDEKSTKTGRSRVIPLSADAWDALRHERARQAADKLRLGSDYADSGHVFQRGDGGPLRLMQITDGFRKIARRAGVSPTSFHTLRHTTATWVLSSGSDVRTTASLLGHSSAATTLGIYAHVLASAQADAVKAIDRLLRVADAT